MIRRHFTAGLGATLLAPRAFAADLVATPAQTEGPFYPTAFPADSDMDLVQVRGLGTVLHLQGRVLDASGKLSDGALVEIWQCDSQGLYDHPRQPGRERRDAAFQGYGKVLTDAQSGYRFRTLKPVAYPGRTPHIHLKVATADGRHLTTQFYLAGDPLNERDFVYREAARDPRRRERVDMRLEPANGLEPGAFATTMDIVIA